MAARFAHLSHHAVQHKHWLTGRGTSGFDSRPGAVVKAAVGDKRFKRNNIHRSGRGFLVNRQDAAFGRFLYDVPANDLPDLSCGHENYVACYQVCELLLQMLSGCTLGIGGSCNGSVDARARMGK